LKHGHSVAHADSHWSQNITFFSIGILKQGDSRGTVGIVFDRKDLRRYIKFVPLKVDDPVGPFMAAAAMSDRHLSTVISTAGRNVNRHKPFFRLALCNFIERVPGHGPTARGGWFVLFNRHGYIPDSSG